MGLAALLNISSISGNGPGVYLGTEGTLKKVQANIAQYSQDPKNEGLNTAFAQVDPNKTGYRLGDAQIQYVLSQTNCNDMDVQSVRENKDLSEVVAKAYFYDLTNRYGTENAKAVFIGQPPKAESEKQ